MKEVVTEFRPDSMWDSQFKRWWHFPVVGFKVGVSSVTVGLMRVYDDMDSAESPSVPIPHAEGKVSVRPYVRGKPRKKEWKCLCGETWPNSVKRCPVCCPDTLNAPTEPLAQSSEATVPTLKDGVLHDSLVEGVDKWPTADEDERER